MARGPGKGLTRPPIPFDSSISDHNPGKAEPGNRGHQQPWVGRPKDASNDTKSGIITKPPQINPHEAPQSQNDLDKKSYHLKSEIELKTRVGILNR